MTAPRAHEFVCLTDHPYQQFIGDEGCGFRWLQPSGPVQCPRCGNVYCRDEMAPVHDPR